jgi:mono/diheme cytochrome c family protein
MNKTLRGLLVAGVPAALGILFGVGVIMYGIQAGHKSEEASAKEDQKQKQTQASSTASGGGSEMKGFVSQNCATCHGQDLKGAFGPSLIKAGQSLSEEELVNILKNGKGSSMPKGLASGKEAEVAKYLKTLK